MRKIAVMVPTRNRPEKSKITFDSWLQTNEGNSDFYFVLDDDNESVYPRLEGAKYIVAPRKRRGMCDATNYAAKSLVTLGYEFIYWMGDDHCFRTAWETPFLEAMNDQNNIGFVYGNDLLQGKNLPTACLVSCNIIQALGYMVPPSLQHLYIDNFWLTLGNNLGKIKYLDHVIIEHLHYSVGKSTHDQEYKDVNNTQMEQADHNAYNQWIRSEGEFSLNEDLKKLVNLCTE